MPESRLAQKARRLAAEPDVESKIAALAYLDCPSDVVSTILHTSDYPWLRKRARHHPNLPYIDMQECVNLHLTPRSRNAAAYPWHADNQRDILQNPALPADLLLRFPVDVASAHPNCPETLILDNWENAKVRFNAARNTGISETIQLRFILPALAYDRERLELPRNPAVTHNTLTLWIPLETHPLILRTLLTHQHVTPTLTEAILHQIAALGSINKYNDTENRFAVIVYSTDETDILNALYPRGNTSKRLNNSTTPH